METMDDLTRRDFLKLSSAALAAGLLPHRLPLAGWLAMQTEPQADVLVCVFLRGALDGLNAVVPYFDSAYYAARPGLAISPPGEVDGAIDLDGRFGLHPSLAPLKPIWDAGELAIVHAAGSPDDSHSHFEAQDYMEHGVPGDKSVTTGWIGRHLALVPWQNPSLFRSVGMGGVVQKSLRSEVAVTALGSLENFTLLVGEENTALAAALLGQLYAGHGALEQAAGNTLGALEVVAEIAGQPYAPASGEDYPETPFAALLRDAARLVRAGIGLEAVCIDLDGFDTHANQGGVEGALANLLAQFAGGLAALHNDLRAAGVPFSLVVMSEFGRRVAENASGGTDHGHGGVMLALGPAVAGGQVLCDWPGLEAENLYGPGDLQVTTDFRDVLGELVALRLANEGALAEVFPGYAPRFPGVFRV